MSSSDSSDSELLLQAFPVPPSDTNDPPSLDKALTSPEEYIKYVRYEASSYPNVIHSSYHTPESTDANEQVNNNFIVPSPEAISQSDESILSNFDSMVEEFRAIKILLSAKECDMTSNPKPVLCSALFEHPPSLLWIAQRSRSELGELAELVLSHCSKKRWKPALEVWIFALLVALEPPFHPDVCYSLRTIAKRCRSLKKAQHQEPSETWDHPIEPDFFDLCLNLVARRFGQLDLLK